LHGLPQEYSATRDQIMGSQVNPTTTSASFAFLRTPQKISMKKHVSFVGENIAFAQCYKKLVMAIP